MKKETMARQRMTQRQNQHKQRQVSKKSNACSKNHHSNTNELQYKVPIGDKQQIQTELGGF